MADKQAAAPEEAEGESTNTLDEDLREALLAASEEPEPVEPEPEEVPDDDESDTPDDDDEPAEVEADESDDDEDSDAPDEAQEDEPGEAITPPEHWSEGDKESFNSLPEAGRKFILRRHKEMEADYTRKTTEIAPLRKALEPFRAEMQRAGLNEAQAMQHITSAAQTLWQYQQQLHQNPKAAIQAIAQQYGVDLGGQDKADGYVDPDVRELRQQLHQVTGTIEQERQQRAMQQQQEVQRTLDEFAANHPHFDDLKVTMGALMQAGQAATLEDAYEKAQWSHPEIREKILTQQQQEKAKQEATRRKAKVKQAKSASKAVSTKNSAKPPVEAPQSLGDTLREELNRQMNG